MANGTGTSLGAAHGTVTITAQLTQAATQIAQFSQQTQQQLNGVAASSLRVTSALNQLAGAFGVSLSIAGAVQFGRMAFGLAETAANAQLTEAAFEQLAASVGASSDEMLDAMQKASRGTVTESQLIVAANRAIVSGVADSAAELAQIMEIARASGQAFGFGTGDAFDKIIRGVSKLEPELLDELGIMLRLDDVFRAYAAELGTTANQLTETQKRQALLEEVIRDTQAAVDAAGDGADTAADKYGQLATAADEAGKSIGEFLNTIGTPVAIALLTAYIEGQTQMLQTYTEALQKAADAARELLGLPSAPTAAAPAGGAQRQEEPDWVEQRRRFEQRNEAVVEWAEGVIDIEVRANRERQATTRQYESQRSRTIENYEESIAQSAADFAKNRMRAEEDYARSVADIHEEAARRDLRMAEDHARSIARMQRDSAQRQADLAEQLDETIAQRRADSADRIAGWTEERDEEINERRADSAKRLQDIEEDYNRQRLQALRSHQDSMADAAARLDARAIFQEQRRFAREQELATDAHQEKVDDEEEKLDEAIANLNASYNEKLADEQEALDKSIDQANKAYQQQVADEREALAQRLSDANEAYAQQLADAKEADAQRLADMATDFALRKTRENQDQAERMGRMAEDHRQELAQMDSEQGARLAQISRHEQEEREQLDDEFLKQLHDLGIFNEDWLELQNKQQAEALKLFEEWWTEVAKRFDLQYTPLPNPFTPERTFPEGGTIDPATGLPFGIQTGAIVPAAGAAGAAISGMGGTSVAVTIASGAINISGVSGQTANDLAGIIDQRIYEAVVRAARGY